MRRAVQRPAAASTAAKGDSAQVSGRIHPSATSAIERARIRHAVTTTSDRSPYTAATAPTVATATQAGPAGVSTACVTRAVARMGPSTRPASSRESVRDGSSR